MIVLGVNLSQTNLLACLREKQSYLIIGSRLILVPLLSAGALYLLGAQPVTAMALLIGVAAPSGAVASMLAQMFGADYKFSARIVATTTLLSAFTMPLFLALAQRLW